MKYLLLIYGDEQGLSETERQDCYAESLQLAQDLHSNGQYRGANPLHPTAMAHQRSGVRRKSPWRVKEPSKFDP